MDLRQNMIIAKGRIVTPEVLFCNYLPEKSKFIIKFKEGKAYTYRAEHVNWLRNPIILNPDNYQFKHFGKELKDIEAVYVFNDGKQFSYYHIYFKNKHFVDFHGEDISIIKNILNDEKQSCVLNYLTRISDLVSLRAEDGTKILSKHYEKIKTIEKNKVLNIYLNPEKFLIKKLKFNIPIFPFGCNASQFKAVTNALSSQISVIQGPPGTGKTQTILNIIANLLISEKTVQVVSNNNSAIENILDKLSSPEYLLDFLVAPLGNSNNKTQFINRQTGEYPTVIKDWGLESARGGELIKEIHKSSTELNEIFHLNELLAYDSQKLSDVNLEFSHFKRFLKESGTILNETKVKIPLDSQILFELLHKCEKYSEKGRSPSFYFKIRCCYIYGIANWKFYKNGINKISRLLQFLFYTNKINELNLSIYKYKKALEMRNEKKLLKELTEMSMKYLRSLLFEKYGKKSQRKRFSVEDLWKYPKSFINEYPIVLSTTYSSRSSLSSSAEYDYLIMDEASQVDIATGALALSCAQNAVIVGDLKQLPNVISESEKSKLSSIFNSFNINSGYNFIENSFLKSVCEIITDIPETLLREHYRCHPKIINFCNQKFYDGKLLIMTKDNDEENVVSVYKTVIGNHQRGLMNQRQIDVIKHEILPYNNYPNKDIGIIAPYRSQVSALKQSFSDIKIDIATVHKFQGREKDSIIISSVDDKVTDFSDNPYLLNVAISRAKKNLCVVTSGNKLSSDSNINDLIGYIEYNNLSMNESTIYSVFDLLYQQYTKKRISYLKNKKRISEYDSENLMYSLILDVINENNYLNCDVICHQQLNMLIRDTMPLSSEEKNYAMHSSTHLDFLLYNKISKKSILAIEVDGYKFHKKGSRQAERDRMKDRILDIYGIPILRFKTNESGEREKLVSKLKEICK